MLSHLLLTFRHRAGVRPYTSPYGFAEPCVFSKQSLPPGLCPQWMVAHPLGLLLPKLRRHFAEFLQCSSLKRLGMLYQSTCVGFGYGLNGGLFPGTASRHNQSNKVTPYSLFVTSSRLRNIHLIPIDYAFLPRLRGRLTLRRLALRRNPWTFGESVSHTLYRYSCQHSHFRYLQATSQLPFIGLRNAPLPLKNSSTDLCALTCCDAPAPQMRPFVPQLQRSVLAWIVNPRHLGNRLCLARIQVSPNQCEDTKICTPVLEPVASVHGLSPVTFSARRPLIRPVSCYAFFKGWLLLSQPPGCFGISTSFPT